MTIFFYSHNYASVALYILEQLSAWSTSRICPSWSRSRVRLNLLLALFDKYPCLFWPTRYLVVYSNNSCFTLEPSLVSRAAWHKCTVQVNNMAMLHLIYTVTHIYITFILLFIPFFILYFFHSIGQAGWPRPFLSVIVSPELMVLGDDHCWLQHPELFKGSLKRKYMIKEGTRRIQHMLCNLNFYEFPKKPVLPPPLWSTSLHQQIADAYHRPCVYTQELPDFPEAHNSSEGS
jgi:hypothetical protein